MTEDPFIMMVEEVKKIGADLHNSGFSWGQIALMGIMMHDSAAFAKDTEYYEKKFKIQVL